MKEQGPFTYIRLAPLLQGYWINPLYPPYQGRRKIQVGEPDPYEGMQCNTKRPVSALSDNEKRLKNYFLV